MNPTPSTAAPPADEQERTASRRQWLLLGAAAFGAFGPAGVLAQAKKTAGAAGGATPAAASGGGGAKSLGSKLRIVIPANAGGGWDQTGRAVGASLIASGGAEAVEYENVGGKGGTIGLEHYVKQYDADPNAVLIGGMVMVGAVALQKPAVTMAQIAPLARMTSDYLVLAVRADSPIRSVKDVTARMQADLKALPIAGASAGSVDHMFIGRMVRAVIGNPAELNYLPFPGGAQVVDALMSGKAHLAISGFSEFKEALGSGQLRAIGISSRRALYGIPAVREQGVDVDMANWRGVFTGRQVPAPRQAQMVEALRVASNHASWQAALAQNRWQASWMAGPELVGFLDTERSVAEVIVALLKLKA